MKRILIYDGVCPTPYDYNTLDTGTLGGTEATVLRVARGLSDTHSVTIAQRNREGVTYSQNTRFVALDYNEKPHVCITLRDAGHYVSNKRLYPNAKHVLWLHDVVSGDYREHLLHHLKDQEATLVTVSDWHKTQVIEALYPEISKGKIRVKRIYNPIAEYCTKDANTVIDPHKLVFFSSPHKGLKDVCELFVSLRNYDNRFTLFVANPGYYPGLDRLPEGVTNLGSLPHKQIIEHVRTALCKFYPQTFFPETFGLVLAESNAVGTPVLCQRIGAASEVIEHPHQFINGKDTEAVIKRILKWRDGERPIVSAKPEFNLTTVCKRWVELLNS